MEKSCRWWDTLSEDTQRKIKEAKEIGRELNSHEFFGFQWAQAVLDLVELLDQHERIAQGVIAYSTDDGKTWQVEPLSSSVDLRAAENALESEYGPTWRKIIGVGS